MKRKGTLSTNAGLMLCLVTFLLLSLSYSVLFMFPMPGSLLLSLILSLTSLITGRLMLLAPTD